MRNDGGAAAATAVDAAVRRGGDDARPIQTADAPSLMETALTVDPSRVARVIEDEIGRRDTIVRALIKAHGVDGWQNFGGKAYPTGPLATRFLRSVGVSFADKTWRIVDDVGTRVIEARIVARVPMRGAPDGVFVEAFLGFRPLEATRDQKDYVNSLEDAVRAAEQNAKSRAMRDLFGLDLSWSDLVAMLPGAADRKGVTFNEGGGGGGSHAPASGGQRKALWAKSNAIKRADASIDPMAEIAKAIGRTPGTLDDGKTTDMSASEARKALDALAGIEEALGIGRK